MCLLFLNVFHYFNFFFILLDFIYFFHSCSLPASINYQRLSIFNCFRAKIENYKTCCSTKNLFSLEGGFASEVVSYFFAFIFLKISTIFFLTFSSCKFFFSCWILGLWGLFKKKCGWIYAKWFKEKVPLFSFFIFYCVQKMTCVVLVNEMRSRGGKEGVNFKASCLGLSEFQRLYFCFIKKL